MCDEEKYAWKKIKIDIAIERLVVDVAKFLKERKARDIIVMNMEKLTSITDFFIICTANSSVQIKALIRDLDNFLSSYELKPLSRNIDVNSPWVLIDYNYFVVHIFLKEGREYYQLEKLWCDAEIIYNIANVEF